MKKEKIPCLIFITTLLNVMPGLLALKDVEIYVEKYVRRGLDVKLSCKYDLEGEALYAVKWYFGLPYKEFYRYLPKENPSALAFQLPGLFVDVTFSNDHDVQLRNVSLEVSGLYKCVVAAEFPFETLPAAAEMMVVVIGDDAPSLELDRSQSQYHPGDNLKAECTSPASYPPANITWYINDIQVENHEQIRKTECKNKSDPVAKSTFSSISFDLPEKVSPVKILCRAQVFTAYDQNSSITTIHPSPRRLTETETLIRSTVSGSGKDSASSLMSCILLLVQGISSFQYTSPMPILSAQ